MTWHVLLFGAPTGGLTGVDIDLRRMRDLVHACLPGAGIDEHPRATRASILAAFSRLFLSVTPGDGVLVYYSGHGVRLRDPDTRQYAYAIVPCDVSPTATADFRYVLTEELSAWFWRLTAVTRNVTWIADCCHAGGVLRGARQIRGVEERRQAFDAWRRDALDGLPPGARDPDSNPHVLRVNASANDRKAFEDAETGGLLTWALAQVLAEHQHRPIVCDDLARLVIRKLTRERQLPAFAGPVRRWWLTADEAPPRAFPTAVLHARGTLLAGGRLLDHRVGDRYVVTGADGSLTSLVITRVLAHRSQCEPEAGNTPSLTVGATAVLRDVKEPRATVELPPDIDPRSPMATAVTATGYIALAGTATAPLVARVVVEGGVPHLVTPIGRRIDGPPQTLGTVLDGLARQSALLALPCSEPAVLATKYTIATTPDGAAVELTSCAPTLKIYVTALELHPDGAIELVTRDQPDGEAIAPTHNLVIRPPRNELAYPRRLVLIVTDTRIDLRAWTREPPAAPDILRSGGEAPWFGVHAVSLTT